MNQALRQPSERGSSSSFVGALIGDGTPLILLTALALAASGGFALFLSVTGEFLPHDRNAAGGSVPHQ